MTTKRLRLLGKKKSAESCRDRGRVSRPLECKCGSVCISDARGGAQHCDYINLMEVRGHHVGLHPGFVYEIALPRMPCRTVAGGNTMTRALARVSLFLRPSRDSSHYPILNGAGGKEIAIPSRRARGTRVSPGRRGLATSSGNWTVVGIAAVYGNNAAI